MGLHDRDWNLFMLEAEEEQFGMSRIVDVHNALRRKCSELQSRLAQYEKQIEELKEQREHDD